MSDEELREKYKEMISETTLYYRLWHVTRTFDWVFHKLENTFYSRLISKPLVAPIFPLGNFRSGTSFLEKVICDHSTTGSFNYASQIFPRAPIVTRIAMNLVPSLNSKMLPIHMPNVVDTQSPYEGEPIWRHCKNHCWTDQEINILDESFVDPHFERTFVQVANKHLYSQQKKTRFVNKNPWNTLRVGYLSKIFPDAKFVYLIRNPYRMLRSQIDLEGIHERTLGHLKHYNEVFSDQFASPRVFFRTPGSTSYIERYKTDRLLATAMSIVDFDLNFDREVAKANLEDRVLRVRYEDLLADFSVEMRSVFDFLGLLDAEGQSVIDDNEQNYLRKDLVSTRSKRPEFGAEVDEVLAPLTKKYGYFD